METKRQTWIDVTKFVAITGVMIDHSHGTLEMQNDFSWFSYYSVSLFVLVMGITLYNSYMKNQGDYINSIKRKIWGIVRPYMIATFIYQIVNYKGFNLEIYLNLLTHFNGVGALYYVALYIQLLIVSPILFNILLSEINYFKEMIGLGIIMVFAYFTTNYTNMLDIYGGETV